MQCVAVVDKLISEQNNILLRLVEHRKRQRGNKHLRQENDSRAKATRKDRNWLHTVTILGHTWSHFSHPRGRCYMMNAQHAGHAAEKRPLVLIVESILGHIQDVFYKESFVSKCAYRC